MEIHKSLKGRRFGRLKVIGWAFNDRNGSHWLCQCECGKYSFVYGHNLTSGKTTSCGCFAREEKKRVNKAHGLSHTRLYHTYHTMNERCFNPKAKSYKDYGGRGIFPCAEWTDKDNFINFYNWAINNGYQNDLTIDRINNDLGYSPDNCRWATRAEQARNKRPHKPYRQYQKTICGITKPLSQWTKETCLSLKDIYALIREGKEDYILSLTLGRGIYMP